MSKQIAITLIEQGNSEAPNIGTITGTTEAELMQKAKTAIESHFDGKMTKYTIDKGRTLLDAVNSIPVDLCVAIDDLEGFLIEAQQTWIY